MSERAKWSAWRYSWQWVRVPHVYWADRVDRVSARALSLDLGAWSLAWRELTDGVVSERDVRGLCARLSCGRRDQREQYVAELVREGFWRELEEGGWELIGWLEWNPSRGEMEARHESYRRRTAAMRRRRAERQAAEREERR